MNLSALLHSTNYSCLNYTPHNWYGDSPKVHLISNMWICFTYIHITSIWFCLLCHYIILITWKLFHMLSYKCHSKGKYRWLLNRTLNPITSSSTRIMRVTQICKVYFFIPIFPQGVNPWQILSFTPNKDSYTSSWIYFIFIIYFLWWVDKFPSLLLPPYVKGCIHALN